MSQPKPYKTRRDIQTTKEYRCKSDPEIFFTVPEILAWATQTRIREMAEKTEVDPKTDFRFESASTARFDFELLVAYLTDPGTTHNVFDGNGKLVDITEQWIGQEMNPLDAAAISVAMRVDYFVRAYTLAKQSADPNLPDAKTNSTETPPNSPSEDSPTASPPTSTKSPEQPEKPSSPK